MKNIPKGINEPAIEECDGDSGGKGHRKVQN